MPLYDIIDKKTGEDVETVFMSYAKLQEYLEENPKLQQKVGGHYGLKSIRLML